jgi:hypothetical protein
LETKKYIICKTGGKEYPLFPASPLKQTVFDTAEEAISYAEANLKGEPYIVIYKNKKAKKK